MSDQIKFRRMLEILMLLSGNFGYTINEIADKFQTTPRTIYRYIDTFKEVGFKVIKQDGFFRIDKKESKFRDLSELVHFSKEEAILLSRAIHLISDENKFKSDLYEKLYYLFDKDSIANNLITREHSDNALKLKRAVSSNEIVLLKSYSSSNSKTQKDRIVEPFEFTSIYDSVWALDLDDQQCKTFKIARIGEVIFTGENQRFLESHVKKDIDVFRFGGDERINISFNMTQTAYNLLIEEYPLSEDYITEKDSKDFVFNGWVTSFIGVSRFLLGLMDEVSINFPDTLRNYLNTKISKKKF
ncbi:WYL domain-containing protein [Prolixibacteraceae bacterium JC049]|nr:WYL domain-containing protein [Prolixibacteraceae bacterium JC049]